MTRSLAMTVEWFDDVRAFVVDAPWLDAPIEAATWEEAYWEAISRHPREG